MAMAAGGKRSAGQVPTVLQPVVAGGLCLSWQHDWPSQRGRQTVIALVTTGC